MFPDLERVIDEIVAVRDCPASRRLCLDCWEQALAAGEAAGLALARIVLAGVREYQAYLARIHAPLYRAEPTGAST